MSDVNKQDGRRGQKRSSHELSDDSSNDDDPEEDLLNCLSDNNVQETDSDSDNSDHDLDEELKDTDDVGPQVNPKIAQLVNTRLTKPLTGDKLKTKTEKYKRPENVEYLTETKVNPAIWADMRSETRMRDMKLKKVQSYLIKGLQAVTELVSDLHEARKTKDQKVNLDDCCQRAFDSITLLSSANYQLNVRRRESIKPDLHPNYKRLCSPDVPITKHLFGDDLAKHCKEIKEVNQVSKNVAGRNSYNSNGYNSYNSYNAKHKGKYDGRAYKKPFLGKKRYQPYQKKKGKGEKYDNQN